MTEGEKLSWGVAAGLSGEMKKELSHRMLHDCGMR